MKKHHTLSANLQRREILWGWGYLAFQYLALPQILTWLQGTLPFRISDAEINFCFFFLNFMAITVIFHSFLGKSAAPVRRHPIYFLQAVILGLAAYYAGTRLFSLLICRIDPNFVNVNDASIADLTNGNFFLMALGVIVLVPPVEECLYRGLIFRVVDNTSRLAAYTLSVIAFCAIHVLGYLGSVTMGTLALCFLQYIPAGLALAWAYTKADTIYAPIVIHMIINAIGIFSMR